jgi:hypothetical protein
VPFQNEAISTQGSNKRNTKIITSPEFIAHPRSKEIAGASVFSGKVLKADIMRRQIRLKETCCDNSETITKQMFDNKATDNEEYDVYL